MASTIKLCKQINRSFRTILSLKNAKYEKCYRKASSFQLYINEYGNPQDVVKAREVEVPPLAPKDVLVKALMSPINPADINVIEGTYYAKPPLPAVVGNEGVGEIVDLGSEVKGLSKGDWVIPSDTASGTWQTLRIENDEKLIKLPNDIPVTAAATISVNPCTAYRMLKDYVDLKEGDVVLQNGANSGVGVSVIQLAKQWNLKTVNVVRNRPEIDQLKNYLHSLGADYVVTEDFLRKSEMRDLMKGIGRKPKLAFNCVGGKCATELLRFLDKDGVMVTYGGMSRRPIMVPTGPLIFKEIKLLGYWNTLWNERHANDLSRFEMLADLCDMIKREKFVSPKCDYYRIDEFEDAIKQATEGYKGGKVLFDFQ